MNSLSRASRKGTASKVISETDLILNPDGSVYHLKLRPEDVSPTVITVGDPDRVGAVSKYFDRVDHKVRRREFVTHTGELGGKRITVASTGMGTDNVEIFLTELDALVNVDLETRTVRKKKTSLQIIRIGTSGALQKDIPLDSHLISHFAIGLDNLVQFYDFRMTGKELSISEQLTSHLGLPLKPYVVSGSKALMTQVGQGMLPGNTLTMPGFYAPQGRIVRLRPKYGRLLDDLASFAYGKTNGGFRLTNFEMETAGYYSLGRLLGHQMVSTNAIIAHRIYKKFSRNPSKLVDSLIRRVLENI